MADEEGWTVSQWLKSFGFERYTKRFIENGYETKKLCSKLKAEDLDEMQITELPHRTILFNQSDMLRTGSFRPSSTQSNVCSNSSMPPPSPATSPCSMGSGSDLNSETYSTVFDDISDINKAKTMPQLKPMANQPKKASPLSDQLRPERTSLPSSGLKPSPTARKTTLSTGMLKLHSISTGPPKTKLELKIVIRELVQRDGFVLNEPPYSNEVSTKTNAVSKCLFIVACTQNQSC